MLCRYKSRGTSCRCSSHSLSIGTLLEDLEIHSGFRSISQSVDMAETSGKEFIADTRHGDSSSHNSEEHMSVGRYLATRITTLKPPMRPIPNPFKTLALLNTQQWLFFLVAFIAWTWDAFDFFTVSLTIGDLAATFHKTNADITWGITLVLMLRSIGAITFGLAADRYGRKWYVYPFFGKQD